MSNPYEPKTAFYTPQTFSKEAKLAEMYGSQASRRDKRKFEKYWNSEQRYNDEDAFNKSETDKMFASADARFKEINNAWKARNTAAQVAEAVTPQETPAPAPAPAPVLRPRRTNAEWDAIAAEKSGGKYKTMQDVIALQKQLGITADGKWGNDTQKAYDAYLAQQNQKRDNITTPGVTTTPETEVATPEHVVRYIPGQGEVSMRVEEPVTTLGKAQPQHWGHRWARPFEGATGLGKDLHDMFIWMGDNGMFQKQSGYQQPRPVFHKQGGTMNRINYFQQGGAAPQQDMQQQVVALVQAAMQGDKKATQTVNQIMEAAKAGDQQATQIAQMIQQVVQQMQGQATAAKWGSKLSYIKSLKYAKGGKTCPACEQKVEMKKCGGKKAKKRYFGGYL